MPISFAIPSSVNLRASLHAFNLATSVVLLESSSLSGEIVKESWSYKKSLCQPLRTIFAVRLDLVHKSVVIFSRSDVLSSELTF